MLDYIIGRLIQELSSNLLSGNRNIIEKELGFYIQKLYDKNQFTKTLLFRDTPVKFYDTYVPLTIQNKSLSIRIRHPKDVLDKYRFLAIIGSAGCGKTTLLKYITLKCIDDEYAIPIYIELRHFRPEKSSFQDFVAMQVSPNYHSEILKLFKENKFIFILDGFDEINYKEGTEFIDQLENFISDYSKNQYIISSRPGTNIESLIRFFVFNIEPLNNNDISILLDLLSISHRNKEKLMDIVRSDNYFKNYLTNPLFLSIYLKYFNDNPNKELPHKNSYFFRNILDSLLAKHDTISKLGYVRNLLSGLGKDQLESISSMLAFRFFLLSKYEFSKDDLYKEFEIIKRTTNLQFDNEKLTYDLVITINILVENNDSYFFPHIILSEYLTSLFISRLDSSTKKTFYGRFVQPNSTYLSVSLLNFLYELDRRTFIEFFLIPAINFSLNDNSYSRNNDYNNSLTEFININFFTANSRNNLINPPDLSRVLYHLYDEIAPNTEDGLGEFFQAN